jgi:predicted secreted hydrolase
LANFSRHLVALLAILGVVSAQADETLSPPSKLSALLGGDADQAFARALQPRIFTFPEDHGPHPEFRNEWWYVTGNLNDDDGRRFGFELTVFRFALAPSPVPAMSAWRTNQVYIAHLAVTNAQDQDFHVAQRYARGAIGLAGAQAMPLRVWIDDWELAAQSGSDAWRLRADDDQIGLDLELLALKPPVLNGIDGLSQKSADPRNASYYYSMTRLQTSGNLRIGDNNFSVAGLSWLDREWSTSALAADQVGWDWFALQFDDGSELMFYGLRSRDGSWDAASAGTFVSDTGRAIQLHPGDVDIVVLDTWESPAGGSYPSQWLFRIPQFALGFTVTPVMNNQELFTTVRYWEGAVDVDGQRGQLPVSGRGYVELTGYADAQATP